MLRKVCLADPSKVCLADPGVAMVLGTNYSVLLSGSGRSMHTDSLFSLLRHFPHLYFMVIGCTSASCSAGNFSKVP